MVLVINLGHDTFRVSNRQHTDQFQSFHGDVLSGASSEFSVIDTTISVQFKPGGACPFLPMPATELTNQIVDLSTLWGTAAAHLREQLHTAKTPETRVRILERFLLARAALEQTRHPAVTFALAQFQARHISSMTSRSFRALHRTAIWRSAVRFAITFLFPSEDKLLQDRSLRLLLSYELCKNKGLLQIRVGRFRRSTGEAPRYPYR